MTIYGAFDAGLGWPGQDLKGRAGILFAKVVSLIVKSSPIFFSYYDTGPVCGSDPLGSIYQPDQGRASTILPAHLCHQNFPPCH